MKILAATGHRPNKLRNEWDGAGPMSLWIQDEMKKIVLREKPDIMISGMALGVDQIWAELAIMMNVPLIAAIPFRGQESIWSPPQQNKYKILLKKARHVENVSGESHYARSFMDKRNEWMVNKCTGLVVVWDGSRGGTYNCYQFADEICKPMIFIRPQDYEPEFEPMDL
jgi:uncharacterized phage-like protein YoqJ